jgi:chemotaxis protein CheD
MGHYIRPVREDGFSTAMFAAPAIVTLAEMMFAGGSAASDLEAHLYGGANNSEAARFEPELAERNVWSGEEILAKLGIAIASRDVGGKRGRKVIFHSVTGETVVARVDRVRASDWYPEFRREK